MTREHKLALIVGFSLILVVGMLVSDHLSKAKQAKIAGVTPAETASLVPSSPAPTDPLKVLASLPPPPQPVQQQSVQPTTLAVAPAQGPVTQTTAPAPSATQGDEMIRPAAPRTLAAGSDQPLIDHIVQQGGTVHRDRNGNIVFGLPSAAEIASATNMAVPGAVPAAATSAKPGTTGIAAKPDALKAGKIYATSRIDMPPAAPAGAADKVHAVQKGESLFQIAAKYYGNGHAWRELAKYNGLREADGGIRVGMKLRIPSRDVLLGRTTVAEQKPTATPATPVQASPAPAKRQEGVAPAKPGRIELATYTVKRGDTLGVIAQKVMGSSKLAGEIADFNKLDDEDNIPVGTVLKVPPKRG